MPSHVGASENSSRDALIAATLAAWVAHACSELSARSIASSAGLNASAIYYYFDDLEHLYEVTLSEAIIAAESWIRVRRAALDEPVMITDLPGDAFAPLLASLIDDWCEQARPLAFAWRECQLLAARNPRFAPLRDAWNALWRDFCADICGRFGATWAAEATFFFFDSESLLHLMRSSRTVDRAALDESAQTWTRWMAGRLPSETPWRGVARERARAAETTAEIPEGNLRIIAAAAARLLAANGAGAVTHRLVATTAGLTLGVVSHKCKRTEDLLKLAYSEIYVELTGGLPDRPSRNPAPPEKGAQPDQSRLLAIDELVLAAARGRVGAGLIGLLRYLRGSTSVYTVRERVNCTELESLALAAVYSSIAMGYWRSASRTTGMDAGADYDRFLDGLFSIFAGGSRS